MEERAFLSWMREWNAVYTGQEYHFRLGMFLARSRFAQEHNGRGKSFTVGMNRFATMTETEYRAILGHRVGAQRWYPHSERLVVNEDVPVVKDWRDEKVVNSIRDQGNCGSCWAFGTIQMCESIYAITHGTPLLACSEQNLVDCGTLNYTMGGCNGGLEDGAMRWILEQQDGYLNLAEDYPYTGKMGKKCLFAQNKGVNRMARYAAGVSGDESILQKMIGVHGPCDIAINAGPLTFRMYTGGIYNDTMCRSQDTDHAVGVVGYGVADSVDFWIVRNSWGVAWGEQGYIRVLRNFGNMCGVATATVHGWAAE